MRLSAKVHVLAKVQKPWTDSNGVEHISHTINIMQNNGEVIDTLRVSPNYYDQIEANKPYTIIADYGIGKNGGYLKVIEIFTEKN